MVRVGINGFGRIGRNVVRAALAQKSSDVEFAAVNDLTDAANLAYLLKYDSVHGTIPNHVTSTQHSVSVDGKEIRIFSSPDPKEIPWSDLGIEVVIEATGRFTDKANAEVHITRGGAKRVIISAPGKDDDLTVVMGVNHDQYDPGRHTVVSNGSCTTNGRSCSFSRIDATAASKSAPARSSLLTKAIRGTPYRSACRHTDSLCGSTPATPSNTVTAPSSTRRDRSTSSEKSTCPGVSIRLMRWSAQ